MGALERVFHAVLFEVLVITLSTIGLALFTDHEVSALSKTMVTLATMAMIWNFVFNWVFDRFATAAKETRSIQLRIVHVALFEAGLLLTTIPMMAWMLNIGLWEAFVMDVGITVFITIYAFVFNYVYDHVRAFLMKNRMATSVQLAESP